MKGIFTAGEKEIISGELGLHFLKAPVKFAVSRVKIEGLTTPYGRAVMQKGSLKARGKSLHKKVYESWELLGVIRVIGSYKSYWELLGVIRVIGSYWEL